MKTTLPINFYEDDQSERDNHFGRLGLNFNLNLESLGAVKLIRHGELAISTIESPEKGPEKDLKSSELLTKKNLFKYHNNLVYDNDELSKYKSIRYINTLDINIAEGKKEMSSGNWINFSDKRILYLNYSYKGGSIIRSLTDNKQIFQKILSNLISLKLEGSDDFRQLY